MIDAVCTFVILSVDGGGGVVFPLLTKPEQPISPKLEVIRINRTTTRVRPCIAVPPGTPGPWLAVGEREVEELCRGPLVLDVLELPQEFHLLPGGYQVVRRSELGHRSELPQRVVAQNPTFA